jgi:DNA topoisomerase-2
MADTTIYEFVDGRWKSYSQYDNERSLPHIMDGLKTVQRKVMYTFLKDFPKDKAIKVAQLGSAAATKTHYKHGEVSITEAVVKLAQDFPGSNNYALLMREGQFGSKMNRESASPRYIFVRSHKNWNIFFPPEYQENLDILMTEGEMIEPKYFIPVVPTILINGANGTGNGFKSVIFQYSLESVIKGIKEIAKSGKIKTPLIPSMTGWQGKVSKVDRQVIYEGVLEINNTTTITISELPPSMDTAKFKGILTNLMEEKVIKDFDNLSTEDQWCWVIDTYRATTALGIDKLMDMFKLVERDTEVFVCWGCESQKPLTFQMPEELLEHWYKERISLYQQSISFHIQKYQDKITALNDRMKFIKWCLSNDFRKLSKKQLLHVSVIQLGINEELSNSLVSLPIYSLTIDEVEKSHKNVKMLQDELTELKNQTPEKLMIDNLKGL